MIIFLNLKSININKLKYVFTRGKAFNKTVPVLLKSELVELMDDDDDEASQGLGLLSFPDPNCSSP